jgi:uracil-DNA glycosylase family 4
MRLGAPGFASPAPLRIISVVMDVLAALKLQVEWGADEALDDDPIDRTAPKVAYRQSPAPGADAQAINPVKSTRADADPAVSPAAAAGRPGIVSRAQQAADAAETIGALRIALAGFTDCPLATTATNLVFADGNPAAGLVFIGEAPGAEEDLAGRPFVGQSGKLLDRMLASIDLRRDRDFLITNLIPWRPPGNRPPTDTELATCLPFLLRHLALLRPTLLVTLGGLSTRMLTGREEGIRRQRGRWQQIIVTGMAEKLPLLPMYHPAYLLRTPGAKKEAWQDLIALRRRLDQK